MNGSPFNDQPELIGDTLRVRPLARDDFEGLYSAAAHPEIWAGHPAQDRWQRDVFAPYFDFLLERGGSVVIEDREQERIIGCSRYYEPPDVPGGIAIGFTFLNHEYWGGSTNFAVKRLMLGHALSAFPAVWFHIDPANIRSQRATVKLGAAHVHDATLDISGKPLNWMCYRVTRAAWQEILAGPP